MAKSKTEVLKNSLLLIKQDRIHRVEYNVDSQNLWNM